MPRTVNGTGHYYYERGTPDLPDKDGYKLWKASCDKDGCPGYYKVTRAAILVTGRFP